MPAVIEDDSPERSRARAKTAAAAGPRSGPSIRWAWPISVTGARPKKAAAATMIMALLMPQPTPMEKSVSANSYLSWRRMTASFSEVPPPALDDLGVEEDVVGHDHGAEDGHDDGDGPGRERRHDPPRGRLTPGHVDERQLEEEGQADERDEGDDGFFEARVGVREEQGQDDGQGQHGRGPQRQPGEEQVQADRGAQDLGQGRRDGGQDGAPQHELRCRRPHVPGRRLGQAQARGDAEVGDVVLEDDEHQGRQGDHPEKGVAVPGPRGDVRGPVAGVDEADRDQESRADVPEEGGSLQPRQVLLEGLAERHPLGLQATNLPFLPALCNKWGRWFDPPYLF